MARQASLGEVGMEGFQLLDEMRRARPPQPPPHHHNDHHQPCYNNGHQYYQARQMGAVPVVLVVPRVLKGAHVQAAPRKGAILDCYDYEAAQLFSVCPRRQVIDCDEAVGMYGGILIKDKYIPTKMVHVNKPYYY